MHPKPWEDPKNGSTFGLYNQLHRNIRLQNSGFYFLDPARALGIHFALLKLTPVSCSWSRTLPLILGARTVSARKRLPKVRPLGRQIQRPDQSYSSPQSLTLIVNTPHKRACIWGIILNTRLFHVRRQGLHYMWGLQSPKLG